jgi:hypothetical protein
MAPAPAMAPAPVAAPAAPLTGGSTGPDRTMMIHTGLLVTALVLALLGMTGDAWSVEETSTTMDAFGVEVTTTTETKVGLDDASATVCINGECETVVADLSETYDNCTTQAADLELNSSTTEEMCGTTGDMASAGFTGTLLIILGLIALIATLVATFLDTRGTNLPFSQFYPFCAAAAILIGVVAWYLMMPEPAEGSDPSLGISAWLTVISSVLAAGAGGFTMYMGTTSPSGVVVGASSPSTSSARAPGLGARTLAEDSEAREFVLRETAMGNQTLSIVEDGNLLRLTKATRGENGTHSEDLFMTRLDALLGFTHERFDWLDSTRYLWNVMAIASLVAIVWGQDAFFLFWMVDWFVILFAVGTLFSMLQFADPELITFETNAGKHRTLIYRAGSNRVLTNTSMELIDSAMRDILRGEPMDPTALNAVADSIETEMAEARRAAEEAAAAQQAAALQAQAEMQAQIEAQQAQMQAQQAQIAAQQAQMQAQMQAQQAAAIPPAPTPPVAAAAPPPAPAAPPPAAIPPIMNPPPAPMAAPPPVASPPPPAPLPPPGGLAAPLPPPMASPDMGIPTETITPAPEIPMQAAPRDDSLSEGEKEDILTDLGED